MATSGQHVKAAGQHVANATKALGNEAKVGYNGFRAAVKADGLGAAAKGFAKANPVITGIAGVTAAYVAYSAFKAPKGQKAQEIEAQRAGQQQGYSR